MDPFDRFLRRPLDEILISQGVLTRERANELLESCVQSGATFGTMLVESNTLTPWDLAKAVATHYQMPVQPLTGYHFDKELLLGLSPEMLRRHMAVPLGVFGATRTFAVLEPPGRPLLDELQAVCGSSIFFFVAEGPEISKALEDHVKVVDATKDTNWHRLFDTAEEEISKGLPSKAEGAPRPKS